MLLLTEISPMDFFKLPIDPGLFKSAGYGIWKLCSECSRVVTI